MKITDIMRFVPKLSNSDGKYSPVGSVQKDKTAGFGKTKHQYSPLDQHPDENEPDKDK